MAFYEFEGKLPVVDTEAFVHPEATLIGDVRIAGGCYIGTGAVLRGDIGSVIIEAGSNVQENCVIHTFPDKVTYLHANTHIGHGSILHGCEICSHVLIGMGSIIADNVKINIECIVGAGSLLLFGTEIPPRSVVMGSPAQITGAIRPEQIEDIQKSLAIYQSLAQRHKQSLRKIGGMAST